jgi:hypothetical protein
MKKVQVRCWSSIGQCGKSEKRVYFTLPDFGDAFGLYTHLSCGAVFAIDRDREYYSHNPFSDFSKHLNCPECGKNLSNVAAYPCSFVCDDGAVSSFVLSDTQYPPESAAQVVEFWDPYSKTD